MKTKSRTSKVMLIILAAVMMISFTACGEDEKTLGSTAESSAKATTTATASDNEAVGTASVDGTEENTVGATSTAIATDEQSTAVGAESTATASATASQTSSVNPSSTAKQTSKPTATATTKPTTTATIKPTTVATPTPSLSPYADAKVGEVIKFGHYEQDNDTSNGKEEIEWIVLAKDGNKLLVTSKHALNAKAYNDNYANVTWATCTLRTWLNGTFLNDAFSNAEQSQIATTAVVNNNHPYYGTNGGNNTQDKVFLLNIDEVNKYFSSNAARELQGTAYAEANNLYTYNNGYNTQYQGKCTWWLRSSGRDNDSVVYVDGGGQLDYIGDVVNNSGSGVRPALWINI